MTSNDDIDFPFHPQALTDPEREKLRHYIAERIFPRFHKLTDNDLASIRHCWEGLVRPGWPVHRSYVTTMRKIVASLDRFEPATPRVRRGRAA